MPKNVLVVGMPRSGTSLTASIFSNQGYYVAGGEEELRKGDSHNPMGYFEAETLVQRNAEIFKSVGFEFDNTWLYAEIPEKAAAKISTLTPLPGHKDFVEQYSRHAPWMWKDPRLCYTLGYWWQLLDKDNTAVLFIKRSPKDILQSFIRLEWRLPGEASRQDVERRSHDHWQAAENAILEFDIPHLTIDYSDYFENPEILVRRLNELFGLELAPADLLVRKELNRSTLKGRIITALKRRSRSLPAPVKSAIKALLPRSLLAKLFPENNYIR